MPKRKNGEVRSDAVNASRPSKRSKLKHPTNHEAGQNKRKKNEAKTPAGLEQGGHKGQKRNRDGSRKERKGKRSKVLTAVQHDSAVEIGQTNDQKTTSKEKGERKNHKPEPLTGMECWEISDSVGGCMLDLDPIFSPDEEYLLIAFESSIRVYATATSMLVRSLVTQQPTGFITAFAISTSNPSYLYLSRDDGTVEKWDWSNGSRLKKLNIGSRIHALTIPDLAQTETYDEAIYTIDTKDENWMITAHRLPDDGTTSVKTLLRSPDPINFFKVVEGGSVVVAVSGQLLLVGKLNGPSSPKVKDMVYTWREIRCSERVTCLDVRLSSADTIDPRVDIVVGGLLGVIFVYLDLLNGLISKERNRNARTPSAQKLHWHRNAVGAVRWSRDGNYIISGGMETVLVLWQVDTGEKEELPHLSAAVESVVVSPYGSSYAIRLADNSAMVISTAELEPTVSVPGLQLPGSRPSMLKVPDVPRVRDGEHLPPLHRRPPVTASTRSTSHLLLAVPTATTSRNSIATPSNRPHLQTYDPISGVQISRQALTRTKVTDLNMGPEANVIEEPNIVLLSTSRDGHWLATVEEWYPPELDLTSISIDKADRLEMQMARLETYLKFWSWNEDRRFWELVARIETPHPDHNRGTKRVARVLDLVEDPSRASFATVADDGSVRMWYFKARYRDGVVVRDEDGKTLTTWACQWTTSLPGMDEVILAKSEQPTSRLAVSADGSLLAVAYQSGSSCIVHLVDATSGDIASTYTDLFSSSLIGIGVIDRYLILLSNELLVWDIVDDRLHYGIALKSYEFRKQDERGATHLAIDQKNQLFAIASPMKRVYKSGFTEVRSQVLVFEPNSSAPLYITQLPRLLKALVPVMQRKGFFAIDAEAEVRMLRPSVKAIVEHVKEEAKAPVQSAGLENIYGRGQDLVSSGDTTEMHNIDREPIAPDYESRVVRQDQLAEIFDIGNPLALPPVTELFEQVAALFAKKAVAVA